MQFQGQTLLDVDRRVHFEGKSRRCLTKLWSKRLCFGHGLHDQKDFHCPMILNNKVLFSLTDSHVIVYSKALNNVKL